MDRGIGRAALFSALSGAERAQSGGVIGVSAFTAELARAGVQLLRADEELLTAHYAAPGGRGDIEYRRFLEDLERAKGTAGRRHTIALTSGQTELLARGKAWLARVPKAQTEPQAKLMAAFQRADHGRKGYLPARTIGECMRTAGVEHMFDDGADRSYGGQGRQYDDEWCRCTEPNSQGQYPYKELMELLCGDKEGAELYSADTAALERGNWRLGPGASAGWVAPTESRGAKTAFLASIGERLLHTKKNYEEVLLAAAGGSATLTSGGLLDCLEKTLGLQLRKEERQELSAFCKERSGGRVKLAAFLEAVGLPAQLVGAAGTGQRGAGSRRLSA